MIRLLRDYRGLLSDEKLLEAGDYDEASLSPELLSVLLEKGYAVRLGVTSQVSQETPIASQEARSEPVSHKAVVEEFVAKANAPAPKRKPKG